MNKKATLKKDTAAPVKALKRVEIRRQDGKIWSHIRKKWLQETPEERVRQEYLPTILAEYGFDVGQMDEEVTVTGRGSGGARADFVIWRTMEDKLAHRPPLIVVECKSDNVTIKAADYSQGDRYARLANAKFFVTHNTRETRFWRVLKDRMPGYLEQIENIPHVDATDQEIEELIAKLKTFKEDEFADLLHQCHNVIRNREHRDPADAFDQIAKILFVKVWVEREMRVQRRRENLFTEDFLKTQLGDDPLNDLFGKTKHHYRHDRIFADDEKIELKPATAREIVRLLERYNLSDTSEDIKGIAFERFLGRTFRGEIGQFFTPRPIVEFMVRAVDPREGDVTCDPASGSGGFLIRFFEIVRELILSDVDREYQTFKKEIEGKRLSEKRKAALLLKKYDELQRTIDATKKASRTWKLANEYIFGTDANERMARTSKMNMIMHGDGHGGVHHHNGFINVNGIFEGRFDIILTNPPFGANVEPSDVITESEATVSEEDYDRYSARFGTKYQDAQARVQAAVGKPILSLYELPKSDDSNIKTEILFVERCLSLLAPGGRLGIVLPEGIFNNPSRSYVREYCEERGFIRAVVSLPKDTFKASGADVRASLLFIDKFTKSEQAIFDKELAKAKREIEKRHAPAINAEKRRLEQLIHEANEAKDRERRRELQKQLQTYLASMTEIKRTEARMLWKEKCDYPIFLYQANRVGITPTNESDQNELYPNANVPPDVTSTCIEQYRCFKEHYRDIAKTGKRPPQLGKNTLIIRWKDLPRWDLKTALAVAFRLSNPSFVPLGEYIEEATELVRPSDEPDKMWPVYGVTNRGGVFFSHDQKGSEFNSAYKRIRQDWFFHNPTRANVGSLGRVPVVPDDAITSPEYQVWRIKKDLRPEFVEALIQTDFFLRLVDIHRVGGVKERLFVQNLMEIPLPVLSSEQQMDLIRSWNAARERLAEAEKMMQHNLTEIDDALRSLCK